MQRGRAAGPLAKMALDGMRNECSTAHILRETPEPVVRFRERITPLPERLSRLHRACRIPATNRAQETSRVARVPG